MKPWNSQLPKKYSQANPECSVALKKKTEWLKKYNNFLNLKWFIFLVATVRVVFWYWLNVGKVIAKMSEDSSPTQAHYNKQRFYEMHIWIETKPNQFFSFLPLKIIWKKLYCDVTESESANKVFTTGEKAGGGGGQENEYKARKCHQSFQKSVSTTSNPLKSRSKSYFVLQFISVWFV